MQVIKTPDELMSAIVHPAEETLFCCSSFWSSNITILLFQSYLNPKRRDIIQMFHLWAYTEYAFTLCTLTSYLSLF